MQAPVRYSGERLRYTGRFAHAPFAAWTESADGRRAVERLAAEIRFALFGRARAARRRLWEELKYAAQLPDVTAALQRQADLYLTRLAKLAYGRDLPCVTVDLRRLVVVPRVFVNGRAWRRIDAALHASPPFASCGASEPLRGWLALRLVDSMEAAVAAARPSVKHPLPAGDGWITVGVNDGFEWSVPFDGPEWRGHYYVLELTRAPVTRAVRAAVVDAIGQLEEKLPALTRVRRNEILREAWLSLDQLFARA